MNANRPHTAPFNGASVTTNTGGDAVNTGHLAVAESVLPVSSTFLLNDRAPLVPIV